MEASLTFNGYPEYHVPFCSPFVCQARDSYSSHLPKTGNSSDEAILWECMPNNCRRRLEGFMAIVTMLAVFTTIFNAIVIAANLAPSTRRMLLRNSTMQNYSTYVISLSMADLLLGAVVLPLVAVYFYSETVAVRRISRNRIPGEKNSSSPNYTITYRETHGRNVDQTVLDDLVKTMDTNHILDNSGVALNIQEGLMNCLGIFTHLSIFISLYTLAAASADRFYISTKPISNRSIRLSSSSFRRMRASSTAESCSSLDISRSTIIVIIIWICGILFSVAPLWFFPDCYFRSVGHMFVVLSFRNNYNASLLWYIVALTMPLCITWIFSSLLCVTLWRRKRKLKRTSRNGGKLESSDRRTPHREDVSNPPISRYSNTETPVNDFVASNTVEPTSQQDSKASDAFSEMFNEQNSFKSRESNKITKFNLKDKSSQSHEKDGTRKRPISFDSSFIAAKFDKEFSNACADEVFCTSVKSDFQQTSIATHSSADGGLAASYVAQRILCRRSWGGYASEIEHEDRPVVSLTPLLAKRQNSFRTTITLNRCSPTTPSPITARKGDTTRFSRPSARVRRRSSVYRAREFLRSKSFESNIAKTLFAVVIAFTVAVLPMLVVLSQLTRGDGASRSKLNNEVTATVVAMTILLSNSFWNCLIYGARMPYFRRAVTRMLRKLLRRQRSFSCCKIIPRKLSISTSSFRKNPELRPTRISLSVGGAKV